MLEIQNVTRQYGNKRAVDDVSLRLETGSTYVLLGPNGSGKTTLMKMIAGLVHPTAGSIALDGEPVGVKTKASVAYMPTENYFYSYMTIDDAGKFNADFFPDFSLKAFEDMLARMELNGRDKIRQLSSGMSAKLRLALTLCREAELMMLDEPLNGVDILTRAQVLGEIDRCRDAKRTMLISTHLVDELEDRIDGAVFMQHGRVVRFGTREALAAQGTLTEQYLKIYGTEGMGNA